MKLLLLFTCFLVSSSVRLPEHSDGQTNAASDVSVDHSTNFTGMKTRRGKLFNSLAVRIKKRKESFHKIFQKIGSSSKYVFRSTKHIVLKAPRSLWIYSSSLPSELKNKIRKLKQRLSAWLSSTQRNKESYSMNNDSNIDDFTDVRTNEDMTECTAQQSMALYFHDDCTSDQIVQIESILHLLTNSSQHAVNHNTTDRSNSSSSVSSNSVIQRSTESGWVLDSELVQRFVMAAGWKHSYHGRR